MKDAMKPKPLWPLLLVMCLLMAPAFVSCYRPILEARANRGSAQAQYQLGKWNFYGFKVARNNAEALKWFQRAADQGHPKAQTALGMMYEQGLSGRVNHARAAHWFKLAADQGQAQAQNQLGILYAQGKGVPQDLELAARYFALAANQGLEPAQHNLEFVQGARHGFLGQLNTRDGKSYPLARLQKVELDGITITFQPCSGSTGLAKIQFRNLPTHLQELYGVGRGLQTAQNGNPAQLAILVVQPL